MTRRSILYMIAGIWLMAVGLGSCRHDPYIVDPNGGGGGGGDDSGMVEMTPHQWINPPFFPFPEIPADNELFVERIALGKQLYFDARLSSNGESCNTCHLQDHGFSMPGVSDFDKGLTSLPLVNLAWYKNFMWSGRITGTLEDVMHKEITERFVTDMAKINAIEDYRTKFRQYYGAKEITAKEISKALAQYMRILVSKSTRYDESVRGVATLTRDEEEGKRIFFSETGDCFHCHVIVLTTDNMMHNNGLDSIYTKDIDKGLFNVTGNVADLGKFRTPNLRNVAEKTDFMHDGRFKTLEEVVEFYDHQSHRGITNIDPVMVKPGKENGLRLNPQQKAQLVAFLKTLTDDVMITSPEFKQ